MPGEMAEEALEGADDLDGDLLERLAYGGEAGLDDLGDLGVVEADDRDVVAGGQAAVAQGVQDAHGEGVGGAHEGRGRRLVEQDGSGLPAGRHGVLGT